MPVFVFFCTFIFYNLSLLGGLGNVPNDTSSVRLQWAKDHAIFLRATAIVSLPFLIWFAIKIKLAAIGCFLPVALISIGYSIPFIKTDGKRKQFRDISFIKIFLIALVWTTTTVALPLVNYGSFRLLFSFEGQAALITRMIFILAITIPFDIRDMNIDAARNIRTIPVLLGINKSKQLAISMIALFTGLTVLRYFLGSILNVSETFALILSAIVSACLIRKSSPAKHDYFYSFLMEGTMLLQYLVVELFSS